MNYAYDNLYRLTSETISGAVSQNGQIAYTYDAVGNRTQMTSTVPAIPAGLFNYDANDRFTAGDTCDANGNTVTSGGIANVYDFENHLIQKDGVTILYDGDGNRVQKTVAGVTTKYLVDELNPTGFAQVVAEIPSNTANTYFVWGLEQISRRQTLFTPSTHLEVRFFIHDGHGSVRQLTDTTGAVTDTYDYDAFGNLISSTGTTPNNYRFAGEQFDPDLNLYYNRARYLDVRSGRFWTADEFEGDWESPTSLHKYLYASTDPINRLDPSGFVFLSNPIYGATVERKIAAEFFRQVPVGYWNQTINTVLGFPVPFGALRPDLVDATPGSEQVYEIKPILSANAGYPQLAGYLLVLNRFDPLHRTWIPGQTFVPPARVELDPLTIAFVSPPAGGVIVYYVVSYLELNILAGIVARVSFKQLQQYVGLAISNSVRSAGAI